MTVDISTDTSSGLLASRTQAGLAMPAAHIGFELRQTREASGQTLSQISKKLHISEDYLRAIEELDTAALPSLGYVLGFMRSYAKYLGMDVVEAVSRYKVESEIPRDLGMRDAPHFVAGRHIRLPKGSVAAVMVLAAFASLAGWYGLNTQAEAAAPVIAQNSANVDFGLAMPVPTTGDPQIVSLRATSATWVQISDDKGNVLTSRIFVPGELFEAKITDNYTFSARDGGALELYRAGQIVGPVAVKGASVRGVSLR